MAFKLKGKRTEIDQYHAIVYIDKDSYEGVYAVAYFSIKTEYRRQGFGRQTVAFLEQQATSMDRRLVFSCVSPNNGNTENPMCQMLKNLGYLYIDQTMHMTKTPT